MEFNDWGLDLENRYQKWLAGMLAQARPVLSLPQVFVPVFVPAKPNKDCSAAETETKQCRHYRCDKAAKEIEVVDDHDSNAGMFYLSAYCSLECFVCDLAHASGAEEVKDVISQIWS